MKRLLTGAAMLVLFAAPAFAQSPSSPSQPGMQSSTTSTSSQTLAASQKIKQDLQSAGFTEVKVVADHDGPGVETTHQHLAHERLGGFLGPVFVEVDDEGVVDARTG